MPLFLPPLARRQIGCALLDLARERERRAPHLAEGPAPLDAHVDVDAARPGGLRPAGEPEVVSAWRERCQRPRESVTTPRQARDRDRRAARQDGRDRRLEPGGDAVRGRRDSPSRPAPQHRAERLPLPSALMEISARPRRSMAGGIRERASDRRTRRRYRSDSARGHWADSRPREARRRQRPGSSGRDRASYSPPAGNSTLRGFEIGTSRPATVKSSCSTRLGTTPL